MAVLDETFVEIRHFGKNKMLTNMYHRQLELALKAISKLHEDLQFDYNVMIEELEELY